MIVYYKLEKILKQREMEWKDLCNAGISQNMPNRLAQNKSVTIDTINKICSYLKVQPGDMMEWIDEKSIEEAKLQNEIDALQAKIKKLEEAKANL